MSSQFPTRVRAFVLVFSVCIIIEISPSLVHAEDSLAWNMLKKRALDNFISKSSGKELNSINPVKVKDTSTEASLPVQKSDTDSDQDNLRQYGHGHYSTSHYDGGGGADYYTLLAVAAFAALFGALFFELLVGTARSMESSTIQLPLGFTLDSEHISQLAAKITEWVSNTAWLEKIASAGAKSRTVRDVAGQMGVSKWVQAYKRDPIEYQCIRKVACETLAGSTLVAKSMKSYFGDFFLSTVGNLIEHGDELKSIVRDTIGNPGKCGNMAPWGFCDEDDNEASDFGNKTK